MAAPTGPFFRRGVTKFVFCPTVALPGAPSRSEITAGTVLTGVTAVSGFQIARSFLDTPTLDSSYTSNVPGERKAGNSMLTFRDDGAASSPVRTALAEGVSGVMVYMPYGDVPSARCETWPVISAGVNDVVDMTKAAEFQVGFATPSAPNQNAVVPT